jgi:hypothetical protein
VGLGLLGFHAALQQRSIPFESNAARAFNMRLFKHIRRRADYASIKLGIERGEAPDMAGTGERFAHKMAIAPNASSSILCGNTSPSIEPWRSNAYLHKTLSGSFPVKNPYLVRELERLGLNTQAIWKQIIGDEGSIQHLGTRVDQIGYPPVYVFDDTGIEVDAASGSTCGWSSRPSPNSTCAGSSSTAATARARSIRRSRSTWRSRTTPTPATSPRSTSWAGTRMARARPEVLYYYRSTTPKRAENTNSKVERRRSARTSRRHHESLSANPLDDLPPACLSCRRFKIHVPARTRDYYKPFSYPWAYQAYKTMQSLHWLPHEAPMADDVKDWQRS